MQVVKRVLALIGGTSFKGFCQQDSAARLLKGISLVPERRYAVVSERAAQTMSGPAYTLYTAGTPNGWKASIVLEELSLSYNVRSIDMSKNEQKEPWFMKINPNGRIPALVDHSAGDLPVFESGAIMWYLASRDSEHKLWPKDPSEQAQVMSWLMFQMGGIGPMQGQASHFLRFAPEKVEYGITRYRNETRRLYEVIDRHLKNHEWLAAGQYSIADIANFSWIYAHAFAGVQTSDLQHLEGWMTRIAARPAVQKGLDVPEPNKLGSIHTEVDVQKMLAEARRYMGSDEKTGDVP